MRIDLQGTPCKSITGFGFAVMNSTGSFFIKTSLKIFKHYKLKPSFPIIKVNKTKDRAGVGDKPPPPSFGRSINPNLIQIFFFYPT